MLDEHTLDRPVILRAKTTDGRVVAIGRPISYMSSPAFHIRTADGRDVYWLASLCEAVEVPQDVYDAYVDKVFKIDDAIHLGKEWGGTISIPSYVYRNSAKLASLDNPPESSAGGTNEVPPSPTTPKQNSPAL